MKFKLFLNEMSYFKNIGNLMSMGAVPFTPKIQNMLGGGVVKETYQVTTIEYLPGMKQLGQTPKQISTFTKKLGSVINSISVKPDVLCKLKGKVIIEREHDVFSHPDKHGLRWIHIRGTSKSDFLLEAINTRVIKLMLELSGKDGDLMYDDRLYEEVFNNLEDKQKKEVIAFYTDRVETLLKNKMYLDIIHEILSINKGNLQHDETIMSNFTVLGVYALETGKYKFNHETAEKDITDAGYKYLGFIPSDGFSKFS
jgi:hypothetical protein